MPLTCPRERLTQSHNSGPQARPTIPEASVPGGTAAGTAPDRPFITGAPCHARMPDDFVVTT